MSGSKYIPSNDAEFCGWAKNAVTYAKEHHERWGITAPAEGMDAQIDDLEQKVARCAEPTRSKVDTLVKNEARKVVERDLRNYIQGMVARNVNVTNEDRQMMGLPIRDTIPTPVGDPVGLVAATVKYLNEGALELHIVHVEGSPYDKRANYGVKIVYDVFPLDAPPTEDANLLRNAVFTRRKKELLTFDKKDAGKTARFCLRYENSKGKAGQWGPVVQAVIP